MQLIKIVIAEDHPITLAGLNMLVDTCPDWSICAQIGKGDEVMDAVRSHTPDVLILDLGLPHRAGLDLLRELVGIAVRPATVVLSGNEDPVPFKRAWDMGADAIVRKTDAPEVIVNAILAVLRGERYAAPAMEKLVATHTRADRFPSLTSREIEVLRCMADGQSSKEIAGKLAIATGTAKKHRENLMRKLDAANAVAAVQKARMQGLLSNE